MARKADASGALLGEREGRMEARHHPLREIDDAEAIRAEHPHSRALGQSRDLALRQGSRRVDLRETGGEHDGDANAGVGAIVKRRKAQFLGNGDDGDIDLLADRLGRRKCRQSLNGIGARIYWINLSVITRTEHELDGKAAELRWIGGRPDDSDAARAEQGIKHRGGRLHGQVTSHLRGPSAKGKPGSGASFPRASGEAVFARVEPARNALSVMAPRFPLIPAYHSRSFPRNRGFQAYQAAPRTAGSPPSRG